MSRAIAAASVCQAVPWAGPDGGLVLGTPTVEVMLQRARGGMPGLVQVNVNVSVSYEFTPAAVRLPVTPASPPQEMLSA
ncbi:MAG TPA: hypothetical protein DCM14_07025 [Clostridiales bacterium UBA8153]|nr:hypothetical protein [Clostridiales bacterium UBA8153]